jgi:hypothetical protein
MSKKEVACLRYQGQCFGNKKKREGVSSEQNLMKPCSSPLCHQFNWEVGQERHRTPVIFWALVPLFKSDLYDFIIFLW